MRLGHLGLSAVICLCVSACSREVSTKAFEKVKERACACKTAACAAGIVTDVKHLRSEGSEAEDAVKAKAELDAALACAVKLDPEVGAKLKAAFGP